MVAAGLRELLTGGGRRGRWRRTVARRALSAVCAAGAVLGVLAVARMPEGGPRSAVLVATRTLPLGHRISPTDVEVQTRPAAYAPAGALTSAGAALGRALAAPVSAGEALTPPRLLGPGLLDGLPADRVALRISPGSAVGALVRAGDRVDLLDGSGHLAAGNALVLHVEPVADTGWGAGAEPPGLVVAVPRAEAAAIARVPHDGLDGRGVAVLLRGR